ncbi:hypothetical protein ACWDUL_39565 [Nocardia niigatensis]
MAEAGEVLTSLRERDVLSGHGSQVYDWADPFGKAGVVVGELFSGPGTAVGDEQRSALRS